MPPARYPWSLSFTTSILPIHTIVSYLNDLKVSEQSILHQLFIFRFPLMSFHERKVIDPTRILIVDFIYASDSQRILAELCEQHKVARQDHALGDAFKPFAEALFQPCGFFIPLYYRIIPDLLRLCCFRLYF